MITENMLARNLVSAGKNASYDASCKRLLANKEILAWIMKSCLEEYRDFDVDEIAEKYIEGDPQVAQMELNPDEGMGESGQIKGMNTEDSTIREGTIAYDIRFWATVPKKAEAIRLIINIEAQNDFYPGYPLVKRGIYYCSRMISSQYGTEFIEAHYEKMKKVYSIWICPHPPKNRENTITRYFIQEENLIGEALEKRENYDLMTVIMICLGRSGSDRYQGILKLLDVLLSSEREVEEKKKILQEEFDIRMTKTLESEVSIMCNLSKGIEESGIKKGIKEGIKEGVLSSIKNLMESMGWPVEQAMEALKVPKSEQQQYANMLAGIREGNRDSE